MIKKLASYVKEYKKYAILTPIFVILEVVMEVIIPLLMAKIIDVGIQNNDIIYIRNRSFINSFSNYVINFWNVIRKICSKSISRIL